MKDAYRDDLAYIHDAGFGRFACGAASVLLDDLRGRGVDRGLVIDLGCGSGILAEQVSATGFDVLGIDISPALVALARQRAPRAVFREGSLLEADLPPCVAIAAVGEGFNYLFDENHSVDAVRRTLSRAFDALAADGVLLFDVAEPRQVPEPGPYKGHAEGDDWAVLVTIQGDRRQQLLVRQITSFRKFGDSYRRDHEEHLLRLFPRALVVSWLEEIGFRVQILEAYGSVQLGVGRAGFLAHKPSEPLRASSA
jgi:SAM-dependent methyltransferase